jgi:hypothetical protein
MRLPVAYMVLDINLLLDAVQGQTSFDSSKVATWFSAPSNPGQDMLGYLFADAETGQGRLRLVMTDQIAKTLTIQLRRFGWSEESIAGYLEALAGLAESSQGVWIDNTWCDTWKRASQLKKTDATLRHIEHEDLSILAAAEAVGKWLRENKFSAAVVVSTRDNLLASVGTWKGVLCTRAADQLACLTRRVWRHVRGEQWVARAS